jgi:hypothetical protein
MYCNREDPSVKVWDSETCQEEVPSMYEPDDKLGPAVKVVLDEVGWMRGHPRRLSTIQLLETQAVS